MTCSSSDSRRDTLVRHFVIRHDGGQNERLQSTQGSVIYIDWTESLHLSTYI